MSSGHLKRLVAPRSWSIARKEKTWTTKPMPGKHSLEGAIPISTILRDYLNVCDNNISSIFSTAISAPAFVTTIDLILPVSSCII